MILATDRRLPTAKYQNEGGPGPKEIIELLRRHSLRPEDDIRTFVDALVYNWLIGGTDAHAKNYSILHGPAGGVRLAPLYDLASYLPYAGGQKPKLKLAMKIGGRYHREAIGKRHWERVASIANLDSRAVCERVLELVDLTETGLTSVHEEAVADGLDASRLEGVTASISQDLIRLRRRMRG